MLKKIINLELNSFENKFEIKSNTFINTKVIFRRNHSERKALYLHGGGIYGDHSLVTRPAEYLISNDVLDYIILPDRRGSGKSTSFIKLMTLKEQSQEMKLLLDIMGINTKITVIGSSYGGLVSLLLADIDNRIDRVVLIGSSPTLENASHILKLLGDTGLLKKALKIIVWMFLGTYPPRYVDQDEFYDLKSFQEYKKMAMNILKHINRTELHSLYLKIDSLLDKHNYSIPEDMKLNIPVFQVIGENDEFWGSGFAEKYKNNFPLLSHSIIQKASHRDVILKADKFHDKVVKFLKKTQNQKYFL